ncbi:hypothetical protein VE04_03076 [Pseudogymnoascus sp. 24MN13]|nr:hypothetical protein VE04_03076 [Pseudogymnoascus sp. 24MN13]
MGQHDRAITPITLLIGTFVLVSLGLPIMQASTLAIYLMPLGQRNQTDVILRSPVEVREMIYGYIVKNDELVLITPDWKEVKEALTFNSEILNIGGQMETEARARRLSFLCPRGSYPRPPVSAGGYGFSALQLVFLTMTAWAGIISAQLCGYLSNDRIPLAVACRSRGIWRPEYRLANTLIPVSCSPSSPSTSSTAKSSRFIAQKSRLFSEMFFAITSPR